MPRLKAYHVQAKIDMLVNTTIKADSLEAAVREARSLGVEDFVEIPGDHIDSELQITGVYE